MEIEATATTGRKSPKTKERPFQILLFRMVPSVESAQRSSPVLD
jgi:hypothetical protein